MRRTRELTILAVAAITMLAAACDDRKGAQKATAMALSKGGGMRPGAGGGPPGARPGGRGGKGGAFLTDREAGLKAPSEYKYETIRGHVVKGSDESSFRPCGKTRVYLTLGPPEPAYMLTQQYNYTALQPFYPVYFVLSAALVDTTVAVGPNVYSGVVMVKQVLESGAKSPPDCPRPRRGSLIASPKAAP